MNEAPIAVPGGTHCRFCREPLEFSVVDLGMSPPCQNVVRPDELELVERFYPLHVRACQSCWLLQIPELVAPEDLFIEYAYFSSYSTTWVEHARRYAETMIGREGLSKDSLVVEIASNDGYLLQHFVAKGIPVLGVEPAVNVASAAIERDVPTLTEFFGVDLARRLVSEGRHADLIAGNNVLAQVPGINDFVAGIKVLLAPDGVATFEVPHVARMLERTEYDTIYHEHFSYFSLGTLQKIFAAAGLALVDVEELPTHGGSIRAFFRHAEGAPAVSSAAEKLLADEVADGLFSPEPHLRFAESVQESKRELLEFLIRERSQGRHVIGYGAPGKGNTLLNYCGIRSDFLDYTVDRNPYKQGCFTPGTRIPIYAPERIAETKPDVIVILPWNLAAEISEQLAYTAAWGARLVTPIPRPVVFAAGDVPGSHVSPSADVDLVGRGDS